MTRARGRGDRGSPPSMRAISSTRASPVSASTAARASARPDGLGHAQVLAAPGRRSGARCVTQRTWRRSATAGQAVADHRGDAPADPRVDLVEDHAWARRRPRPGRRGAPAWCGRARPRRPPGPAPSTPRPGWRHRRNSTRSKPRGRHARPAARAAIAKRRPVHAEAAQLALHERRRAVAAADAPPLRQRVAAAVQLGAELGQQPLLLGRSPRRDAPAARARAAASSRKASIAASVSPYFRLSRASASSRSSISSRRPGSTATRSRSSRTARQRVLVELHAGAVDRLGRRGERRVEPARARAGDAGPRAPAGSDAELCVLVEQRLRLGEPRR